MTLKVKQVFSARHKHKIQFTFIFGFLANNLNYIKQLTDAMSVELLIVWRDCGQWGPIGNDNIVIHLKREFEVLFTALF